MTQPPDPETTPADEAAAAECEDAPKLTAEEWAAVAELSPEPPEEG
jgi:hypothetical protein